MKYPFLLLGLMLVVPTPTYSDDSGQGASQTLLEKPLLTASANKQEAAEKKKRKKGKSGKKSKKKKFSSQLKHYKTLSVIEKQKYLKAHPEFFKKLKRKSDKKSAKKRRAEKKRKSEEGSAKSDKVIKEGAAK